MLLLHGASTGLLRFLRCPCASAGLEPHCSFLTRSPSPLSPCLCSSLRHRLFYFLFVLCPCTSLLLHGGSAGACSGDVSPQLTEAGPRSALLPCPTHSSSHAPGVPLSDPCRLSLGAVFLLFFPFCLQGFKHPSHALIFGSRKKSLDLCGGTSVRSYFRMVAGLCKSSGPFA